MSWTDEYVAEQKAKSPLFAYEYDKECERLEMAVALIQIREAEGLSQRQLAKKVGKPQSTIARIESGKMNVSFDVLSDIVHVLGRKLKIV